MNTLPMVPLKKHLLYPMVWVGNGHLRGKTRCKSWYSWTGDDRNAYCMTAAGSRSVSAMECGESVVRAILTVSIPIFALRVLAFKAVFSYVQRKRMHSRPASSANSAAAV